MKFKTTILQTGNNTGIEVTDEVLEQLGAGKNPLVIVTIGDFAYRSAVGKMGDKRMISLSAENRKSAKVKGGDLVEITIELDSAPRTVDIPGDFQKALDDHKTAKNNFEKLAPSKQKAIVLSITEAKTEETRARRIEKAVDSLK